MLPQLLHCQCVRVSREELGQKMDNKRQEISECQRTERDLESKVHRLKEEKLRLQGQLQKRESLVSKKSDLAAQVKTLEREVKVRGWAMSRDHHVTSLCLEAGGWSPGTCEGENGAAVFGERECELGGEGGSCQKC